MTRLETAPTEFVESADIIVGVRNVQWSHHTSDLKTTTILRIIEQTRQYIRDFDRLAATTTSAQDLYIGCWSSFQS